MSLLERPDISVQVMPDERIITALTAVSDTSIEMTEVANATPVPIEHRTQSMAHAIIGYLNRYPL